MAVCPRVIVALPNPAECAAVAEWLSASHYDPVKRVDPRSAAGEMHARDFDLLVADASFVVRDRLLAVSRQRNPSMPVIVIGDTAETGLSDAMSCHAMYLGRPVERATLVCTVMMAIMEGRPARRSARRIANHFEAVVNDVPAHIIDASYHGLRFQMSGKGMPALPPYFSVRVPLVGLALIAERVWARAAPHQAAPVVLCGAAFSANNRPGLEQRWRGFVDMLPAVGTR